MDNPEHNTLPAIRDTFTKSFLKSREVERQSGCKFFQDNKIRTCSFVQSKNGNLTAVPFYERRKSNQTSTPGQYTASWSAQVHSNKETDYAGMGTLKPLTSYNPNLMRSRLMVPDYIPVYRNSSVLELGNRQNRDDKHWLSTYGNDFKGRSNSISSNPAITARRNKWQRHLIAK